MCIRDRLHTDPAVFGGAQTYLYVQFGGSLIIIAYNMAAAVLRCLGDSRTPLFAIIAATFANIALDLPFVMEKCIRDRHSICR